MFVGFELASHFLDVNVYRPFVHRRLEGEFDQFGATVSAAALAYHHSQEPELRGRKHDLTVADPDGESLRQQAIVSGGLGHTETRSVLGDGRVKLPRDREATVAGTSRIREETTTPWGQTQCADVLMSADPG
jgi:hypothetical protein